MSRMQRPHDDLTDVAGIRVGHATRNEPGWATGCTVVVPDPSCICGVDVRGGAPGTRETDLLDPRNLVDRVDAVVLAGGSAFGLRTADGVMDALAARGRGWPVGDSVVPIVPAAVLFDLGRGGDPANHPSTEDGRTAYEQAMSEAGAGPVPLGRVGAGTGARVDRATRPGGVGSASAVLPDGTTVAALVAVNALGAPVGTPVASGAAPEPGSATTIGVVATDAALTKAECAKLAGVAHDGLARAVSPVHTAFDGDTFFALATGARPPLGAEATYLLQSLAADCVTRAIAKALVAAGG